ncbi:CU044_5270 family protein [Streptomyces sp. BV286]|uniref:CU044_5270 family protein n=1 Tax=Streptomyces sp. BV286 TaxID=2849672 RepID=UPI001C2EE0F4|nr:CU044_5270 family protein [Streptomyces sp. BV286]MBV1942673.1 CU044_5270 family protein [Streptomyces sp. BV286]
MNDDTTGASSERHGDREEIARRLPAPADWDLPREQHLRHRDLLMHHIDHDQAARTRPARRLLRPAVLAPATALALACAVTAGIALTGGDPAPTRTEAHRAATDMQPAAALLDRISDATETRTGLTVRDDQFVYTREKTRGADLTSGKAVLGPLMDREVWAAEDPAPLRKLGLIREGGETFPINAELGDTEGTPAGINRPTYRWLSSLPSAPDKLLTYLYAKTPQADGRERDQAVFEQIGSLLGGVMPPRTAAALYRAAAKIPGVTPAPEARDAIGRKGLGIARDDTRYGIRTEWVFDEKDFAFLGSRSYLTKDVSYGKAGTLLSSTAELEHAVVDEAGRQPTDAERTEGKRQS